MTENKFNIREIKPTDNPIIARVIRNVLIEYNVPKVGTAYEDITLDLMYETYNIDKAIYYIIEKNNIILGGAGIMQLENSNENICELQKMYFLPEARGKGLGKQMINLCIKKAIEFGYQQCYLETMPYMENARKLYKNTGFRDLDIPKGNTGHYSCNRWMLKDLK